MNRRSIPRSTTDRGQARTVGLVLLMVFGLILIVSAIGVFCWLTGDPVVGCTVEVLNPF